MALPKKGVRKITVNNEIFAWNVKPGDYGFSLSVVKINNTKRILRGYLKYQYNSLDSFYKDGELYGQRLYKRIIITPKTISEIIEFGIKNGWSDQSNCNFSMGEINDKIKLRLRKEIKFPEIKDEKVVMHCTNKNGKLLDIAMQEYDNNSEIYHVFKSIECAKKYAKNLIEKHTQIECWIRREKKTLKCYISTEEINEFK